MAMQDHSKFNEWERAAANLKRRQEFYEAAKSLSKKHALLKHCEEELAKAQAAYNKIVSELD